MSDPASPPPADAALVGRVINLVGALALAALLGIIALALLDRPVPDVLQNIAVGSLTGLTALLVTRQQR
ncbi:hypothetical protein [Nocardioides sp. InS609-2]|uniref:hypothetical protein n=1 Tax=Nocardioides sp. InS609-2 TaxID=2760705 RepID=UPI0020BE3CC1|nr:hypothetical protein [Nocardioides sp. InS609-2]